jgi:hypothetical protein
MAIAMLETILPSEALLILNVIERGSVCDSQVLETGKSYHRFLRKVTPAGGRNLPTVVIKTPVPADLHIACGCVCVRKSE